MITLDSGVLIAHFSARDAHHTSATVLLERAALAGQVLYMNPINHAETLVHAAKIGAEQEHFETIESLGVTVLPPPADAGVRLAQMRAATGLKLPDCCVILTADQSGSRVATFDSRLARAARQLGIEVES